MKGAAHLTATPKSGVVAPMTGAVARRTSCFDFLKSIPPGESLDVVEDKATIDAAFAEWLREGKPPRTMVLRTHHTLFGNDLIKRLAAQYRGTDHWSDFLDAVLALDPSWFDDEGPLSPHLIASLFANGEDLHRIVEMHFDVVSCRDHPLAPCFPYDVYWRRQVAWFIARGEYGRAFDKLVKARHGFYVGLPPTQECSARVESCCRVVNDAEHRIFPASHQTVADLTKELFHSMVEQRLVKPITEDDLTVVRTNRHPPQYELACQFRRKARAKSDTFFPEGIMILRMAAHFQARKNSRRMAKLRAKQPA